MCGRQFDIWQEKCVIISKNVIFTFTHISWVNDCQTQEEGNFSYSRYSFRLKFKEQKTFTEDTTVYHTLIKFVAFK